MKKFIANIILWAIYTPFIMLFYVKIPQLFGKK